MRAEQLQVPLVRIKRSHDAVYVSFTVTAIDEQNFAVVADQLEEIVRCPAPQSLFIDLSVVRRIDELGLAVLQSLQESVKEVGGTVRLSGQTDQIKRSVSNTQPARPREIRDSHRQAAQSAYW